MEDISVKLYPLDGGDMRRFPFQIPSNGSASFQGIYAALFEKVQLIYPKAKLHLAWKGTV